MNVITDIMGNAKDGTLVIASKFLRYHANVNLSFVSLAGR